MSRGSTIYSVEGAVWAALSVSWLIARTSISRSPLEEAAIIPAAILGVSNLLCSSISSNRENSERLYFQMIFAVWFAFLYEILECITIPELTSRYLHHSSLGSILSVASASLSLAIVTVQTLIASAPVSDTLWQDYSWTYATVPLVSSFHACSSHDTAQSMGLSAVILFSGASVFSLLIVRAAGQFPLDMGILDLSLDQILEITCISLKVLCAIFALSLAYTTGHTTWLLPVALAIPLVFSCIHLIFKSQFREIKDASEQPSAPTQRDVEAIQPKAEKAVEQKKAPAPQISPLNPSAQRYPHQPHVRPRQMHGNLSDLQPLGMHTQFSNLASRVAQDALLFGNTKPLVAKLKKNI